MSLTRRETFGLGAALGLPVEAAKGISTPGLSLNEDNSHFFFSRGGHRITSAELDEWVDQYAGTQVRELMLSTNSMRTNFPSRVWTPIWHGYQPDAPDDQPLFASLAPADRKSARRWVHAAWQLNQDGIDIYQRWLKRARARGIGAWLSMRMNDVHNTDDERCYLHGEFWRAHPEYRRVNYRFAGLTDRAFDYAHPEVYRYHFGLVRELAERYDFDGLELDWMRFGFHFRPGYEAAGMPILTRFVSETRSLLDVQQRRRGHRIELAVRMPSRPEVALGLGMDAVTWARRGLVSRITVTPFWATIDTGMPVDLWKRLLDGTNVILAAGLELLLRPYPSSPLRQTNSLETVRAAAATYIARGVDRIYLFNYMDSDTTLDRSEGYPQLLRQAGAMKTIAGKPRRHVVTYPDTSAPGEADACLLPAACRPGRWNAFRLDTGPAPVEQKAEARIAVEGAAPEGMASSALLVNGVRCSYEGIRTVEKPAPNAPLLAFAVPSGTVQNGHNVIELSATTAATVVWVELAFT